MLFWPDHHPFDRSTLLRGPGRNRRFRPKLRRLRRPRQEAEVRLAALRASERMAFRLAVLRLAAFRAIRSTPERFDSRRFGSRRALCRRSFIVSVDRSGKPRVGSRRSLAAVRPEQEVPAEPSLHHPSSELPRLEQEVPVEPELCHPRSRRDPAELCFPP